MVILEPMNIRPLLITSLFLLPKATLAAPSPKPAVKAHAAKFSIDPTAKAVLEGAAKLYGATTKWSGQIIESDSYGKPSRISVAYVRPQFIRIENRDSGGILFEMADGKTVSSYIQYTNIDIGNHSTRKVQLRTLSQILGESMVSPKGSGELLAALLAGKTGLPNSEVDLKTYKLRSIQLKSLTAARWKGHLCQRILLERQYISSEAAPFNNRFRYEHWFTADGKLVKSVAQDLYEPPIKNEIVAQNFSPSFGPNIFKFSPPKEKPFKR